MELLSLCAASVMKGAAATFEFLVKNGDFNGLLSLMDIQDQSEGEWKNGLSSWRRCCSQEFYPLCLNVSAALGKNASNIVPTLLFPRFIFFFFFKRREFDEVFHHIL